MNISLKKSSGYTLVELAISTSIIALLAVGSLTIIAKKNAAATLLETHNKMEVIDQAIKSFIRAKRYIPCPALPRLSEANQNFGKSENMTTNGAVTVATIYNTSTHSCSNNGLVQGTGAIPVKTLNLADEFAYDGWGRKFTFRTATSSGSEDDFTDTSFKGDIRIVDLSGHNKTNMENAPPYNHGAMYIIISHGANGKDVAWRRNYDYPEDGSEDPAPATGIEAQNTLHDDAKTYIQDKTTDRFDDLVVYGVEQQVTQPRIVESPIKINPIICNHAKGIVTEGSTELATHVSGNLGTDLFKSAKDISYMCNNDPSGFRNEANPSSIPGLITWLDASDGGSLWEDSNCETTPTTNGNGVGCWRDKSGLGHHAVHATGNNPTYQAIGLNNLPSLAFNGGESLAISSQASAVPPTPYLLATSSTPYTIFIAAQTEDTGTFVAQKAGASPAQGFFAHAISIPTPTLEFNLLGDAKVSTAYNNNPFVVALRWDGTNGDYFISENTFPLTTTNVSTETITPITLGMNGNGTDGLTGYISEVVIFNRALNTDTLKGVKSYLASKWNIDEGTGNSNCPLGMVYSATTKNPLRTCHCSNEQEQVLYNTGPISSCFPDNSAIGRCVKIKTTPNYEQPPTLSNLQLWLDADDCSTITVDEDRRITQWTDKSDNRYTATATSGHGPTYHSSAIALEDGTTLAVARFDNTNSEYLSLGTAALYTDNNLSVYAMVTAGDMTQRPTIFSTRRNDTNGSLQLEYGSDGGARLNSVSVTGTFTNTELWVARSENNVLFSGVPYLFEYVRSDAGQAMYINGVAQTLTDNNATGHDFEGNSTVKLIGAGTSLDTKHMMDGGIGEVLFYNTRHDNTQRQKIETYLSDKWGIDLSIPANPNPGGLNIDPALWLDASLTNSGGAEPSNGSTMTSWKDRRTQAAIPATGAPTYHTNSLNGLPTVQFPTQGSYFSAGNTSTLFDSRNMTISFVYSVAGGTSDRGLFGTYEEGSSLFGYYNSGNHFGAGLIDRDETDLPSASSSFSGNNNYVINTVIATASGQVKIYHNGVWETSDVSGAGSFSDNPFFIGAINGLTTGNANVNLAEFVGYNTNLTKDERQAVEDYLSAKWGIAVSF